jgi:hypothetical protein
MNDSARVTGGRKPGRSPMAPNAPKRPITLAMLRSFQELAKTNNVSMAAEQLRLTRQTLRRHIDDLEALKGAPLFTMKGGRYVLTSVGRECLSDAEDILRWCDSWDRNSSYRIRWVDGFEHATFADTDGRRFYSQQHSLASMQNNGIPLLSQTMAAWGTSLTQIEHPAMARLRPYLVLFRRMDRTWVFADVGEKSAYARWFGRDYALSAPGALYNDDRAGDDFNTFISRAYLNVLSGGTIRFDHLYAHLPRSVDSAPEPISFQRLLAGGVLPDGSQALVMLAVLTRSIDIAAMRPDDPPMCADMQMNDEQA